MKLHRLLATAVVTAGIAVLSARADSLQLTASVVLDISALNLTSIGDVAFERGAAKLWITDGTNGSLAFKVSPTTGVLISTVDVAAITGFSGGPDAIGVLHSDAPDLCVFSSLGQQRGGRVTQAGALVIDYGATQSATGADTDEAGTLVLVVGTVAGGGSRIVRVDPATGATLSSVQIAGTASRMVDVAFDPHTEHFYCLAEDTDFLLEVDPASGAVLSQTDLAPFLLQGHTISGGLGFNSTGTILYVGTGTGTAADSIVTLRRDLSVTVCDGTGAFGACPCGGVGFVDLGCPNSAQSLGARLDTIGISDVSSDTLVFQASLLPVGATALVFQGTNQISPSVPFGDGLRCVGGTIIRLSVKTATTGSFNFPQAGDPLPHVAGLVSGAADRFYQVWYRDSAAFCTSATFNTTTALKVHWRP